MVTAVVATLIQKSMSDEETIQLIIKFGLTEQEEPVCTELVQSGDLHFFVGRQNASTNSYGFNNLFIPVNNCGIRHVTVPLATRILIANVRHIGVSNICVINLVYFKMQV